MKTFKVYGNYWIFIVVDIQHFDNAGKSMKKLTFTTIRIIYFFLRTLLIYISFLSALYFRVIVFSPGQGSETYVFKATKEFVQESC